MPSVTLKQFYEHLVSTNQVKQFILPILDEYGRASDDIKEKIIGAALILGIINGLKKALPIGTDDNKIKYFMPDITSIIMDENDSNKACPLVASVHDVARRANIDSFIFVRHPQGDGYRETNIRCLENCAKIMLNYYNSIMSDVRLDSIDFDDLQKFFRGGSCQTLEIGTDTLPGIVQYLGLDDVRGDYSKIIEQRPGMTLKELARISFLFKKPTKNALDVRSKRLDKKEVDRLNIIDLILEKNPDARKFTRMINECLDRYYAPYSPKDNISEELLNMYQKGVSRDTMTALFDRICWRGSISPYVIIHILIWFDVDMRTLENDHYWAKFLPENQL